MKYFILIFALGFALGLDAQELIPFLYKNGKYGYVDKQKKAIIPGIYEEATAFGERISDYATSNKFATIKKDGRYGFLLSNRQEFLTDNKRSEIYQTYIKDADKYLKILYFGGEKIRYYFDPATSKTVQFNGTSSDTYSLGKSEYTNNMFTVGGKYLKIYQTDKNLVNYLDSNLVALFKGSYRDAVILNNNRFIVKGLNGGIGMMDSSEKMIIPFVYQSVQLICDDSFIQVKTFSNKLGIYEVNGHKLLDTLYDNIDKMNDYFLAERDKLVHLFSLKGQEVITQKASYSSILSFGQTLLLATSPDSIYVLDGLGKVLYADGGVLERSVSSTLPCNTTMHIDKVAIVNGLNNRRYLLNTALQKKRA